MSGGSLNYFFTELESHALDLGDHELNNLVRDLADLFHDREWYLSGDTCEGTWREARDAFKAKWFTEHGRQERIEKYLAEFAEQVRETFGMSKKRCSSCKYWTGPQKPDSKYGKCEYEKHCSMHRSENCERFEERPDPNPCPACNTELKTGYCRWDVDEERYKMVEYHYCPKCGWSDRDEED